MSDRMRRLVAENAESCIGGAVRLEKEASISGRLAKLVLKRTLEKPVQKYLLATGIARSARKGRLEHRMRMEALRKGIPVGQVMWMKTPRRRR